MTNGDWIRSMTDLELALFIYKNTGNFMSIICSEKYVIKVFREWLSSEYEDKKNSECEEVENND